MNPYIINSAPVYIIDDLRYLLNQNYDAMLQDDELQKLLYSPEDNIGDIANHLEIQYSECFNQFMDLELESPYFLEIADFLSIFKESIFPKT